MGHYVNFHETYKVKYRPGYLITDLSAWWSRQAPSRRDGCTSRPEVRTLCDGNYTKSAESAYAKTFMNGRTPAKDKFMENIPSYGCHAVLLGIAGWRAERKVRKVVDHHITEVVESKDYKSRPKTPLKGSTLYAIGVFCLSYDARCYDPWEHGDIMPDEW